MSNTKHTPGPWRLNFDLPYPRIFNVGRIMLASVDGRAQAGLEPSAIDANARLIAAAPELAEALRDLADYAEYRGIGKTRVEAARAALAKAGL